MGRQLDTGVRAISFAREVGTLEKVVSLEESGGMGRDRSGELGGGGRKKRLHPS